MIAICNITTLVLEGNELERVLTILQQPRSGTVNVASIKGIYFFYATQKTTLLVVIDKENIELGNVVSHTNSFSNLKFAKELDYAMKQLQSIIVNTQDTLSSLGLMNKPEKKKSPLADALGRLRYDWAADVEGGLVNDMNDILPDDPLEEERVVNARPPRD